jgi:hypothetical protein
MDSAQVINIDDDPQAASSGSARAGAGVAGDPSNPTRHPPYITGCDSAIWCDLPGQQPQQKDPGVERRPGIPAPEGPFQAYATMGLGAMMFAKPVQYSGQGYAGAGAGLQETGGKNMTQLHRG